MNSYEKPSSKNDGLSFYFFQKNEVKAFLFTSNMTSHKTFKEYINFFLQGVVFFCLY